MTFKLGLLLGATFVAGAVVGIAAYRYVSNDAHKISPEEMKAKLSALKKSFAARSERCHGRGEGAGAGEGSLEHHHHPHHPHHHPHAGRHGAF